MSGRPKILILIKGLGLGGAERLLSQSIPFLDRASFEYEVAYLTPWKRDLVPAFERAAIPVFCLEIRNELNPVNIVKMRAFLRQRGVDLIHSHSPYPGVLARLVAPFSGVSRLVHTEHSLPRSRRRATQFANRLTYRMTDFVLTVSNDVGREVERGRWLRPPRLRVIRGGVDEGSLAMVDERSKARRRKELGVKSGHHVVGNVAHLRPQKGHTVLLEAARLILEQEPNTTFIIVGREKKQGFQKQLEDRADELGIRGNVIFTGFQPDPYPTMATFDVFMMSSLYEGFPIALVEAMAMGVAVVATHVGGVGEAVTDEVDGLLAPSGDAGSLAASTLKLLRDPGKRALLAANGQAKVISDFSIRRSVEEVESIYRELLL